MRVRVLFFGVLRDMVGASEMPLTMPEGATVADVLAWTAGTVKDTSLLRSLALAVNQEYATAPTALNEGDEVALLPPVSGGG